MASGTGNLPHPALSFSPFAILTAEEMNDLAENIESLADGTGIGDGSVTTNTLAQSAVTSEKLAEAFFRGRFQTPTADSQATGLTFQMGWNYVVGTGSSAAKAITFPQAFSSSPIVIVNTIGAVATASGTPDDPNDFTSRVDQNCAGEDITTTGFNASFSATTSSSFNYGFSWIAIGTV